LKDLKVCKANLDKKVNKEETLREFIRNSEDEFEFANVDIDNVEDEELEKYVEFLDDLWGK
jgi:glutaredoxin